MIKSSIDELFTLMVSIVDQNELPITGADVYYNIRTLDDAQLTPAVSGTLSESSMTEGVYSTELAISTADSYIGYIYGTGFATVAKNIMIYDESLESIFQSSLLHNLLVETVVREGSATTSQMLRNVGVGKTDYVITKAKRQSDTDFTSPVGSGISYAYYRSPYSDKPYLMGGPF